MILLLGSCQAPKRAAYIDVDRALAAEIAVAFETPQVSARGESVQHAGAQTLPPLPEQLLHGMDASERLAKARMEIQLKREESLEHLKEQIFESLLLEVEKYRISENAAIEARLREALASTSDGIGKLLREYAEARWPQANRLTLLVDFPFPSLSAIPPPGETPLERSRHREIVGLYDGLAKLQDAYHAKIKLLFGEYYDSAARARLDLGLSVVLKSDEAETAARKLADSTISSVNDIVLVKLLDTRKIGLASVPGASSSVSRLTRRLPEFEPVKAGSAIISMRKEIEADLAIWLGTHARFLAPEPAKAPDETQRFLEWRKQVHHGR